MREKRADEPIRVLFVCLGNICRSPMAEAIFKHLVKEAGLERRIVADSAGTGHWHVGSPPHQGTRRVLERAGIAWDHRARLVTPQDLQEADYVIPMDSNNLRDLQALGSGRARVAPLLAFAPAAGSKDVPDPYYDGKFNLAYDLILQGCEGLLAEIRREYGL